jgi:hypothetical protein
MHPLDNFVVSMEAKVKDLMTERLDQNQGLVMRFLNDEQFQKIVWCATSTRQFVGVPWTSRSDDGQRWRSRYFGSSATPS